MSDYVDTWKDQPARGNIDAQARALEAGSLEAWDDIQIGETRSAELAKKPAGALVRENPI